MIYQQKLHPPAPYHEDAPCVEFSAIRFPGDLTLVYAAFLGAISAHNFRRASSYYITGAIWPRIETHIQAERFLGINFGLWCDSYPATVQVISCYIDGTTATLEVEGNVDGKCVRARVVMQHGHDGWRVDQESFID